MPYKAKGKCVYKADTGKKVGCTKGPVSKYLAALHANVPDVKSEQLEKPMEIKLSEIAKRLMEDDAEKERQYKPSYGHSNRSMVGITFFEVPSGKEEEAKRLGLTQFKSGKFGVKHQFDKNIISVASDREKSMVSSAERVFGKGRYWEPKK